MRITHQIITLAALCLFSIACQKIKGGKEQSIDSPNKILLDQNWEFRQNHDSVWMDARVPGYVHTDLQRNGVIEDPYYRRNEIKAQWIEEEDWEYRTTFDIDKDVLRNENVSLVFKGIDTYADIFINEEKAFFADNMFIEWRLDAKPYLKEGKNTLRLLFHSPINEVRDDIKNLGYQVPINNEDWVIRDQHDYKTSTFTRKAQFHYGWDWAPRLVSSGIWRPVYIEFWNDLKLVDSFFQLKTLNDTVAGYTAQVEISSSNAQPTAIKLIDSESSLILAEKKVSLEPGTNLVNLDFEIRNPELWWPRGLGKQHLYTLKTVVENENGKSSANEVKIGVRTMEWITRKDEKGETFFCKVNEKPIFWKGANYVPLDVFFTEVTPDRYEKFFQAIVDANFNSLRVWGGAIYENDIFYDLADKYGILIWNDFNFACTMVPDNQKYLENVKKEAEYNVKRLRNHPALSLWCGNNEILMFWNDRWKHLKNTPDGDSLQKAYDNIFMDILPEAVKKYDSVKFYWASSPSTFYGEYIEEKSHTSGDKHDWSVFFGMEDPRAYNRPEGLARFVSEYGLQAYPSLNTVKKFAEPRDFDVYSPVMEQHHKVRLRDGNEKMMHYINLNYRMPKTFEMLLYVSQVMQAEGIKTGAEAHRRNMPYTMGSLYWQANDCWPVTSWSGIDYYGTWKALHYITRDFYADILVSPWVENNAVSLTIVSDKLSDTDCRLLVEVFDFDGKKLYEKNKNIKLGALSAEKYFEAQASELNFTDTTRTVLKATVLKEDSVLSRNYAYFARPKNLNLPDPGLKWEVSEDTGVFKISLNTEKLAKNVYLEVDEVDGHFSNNFFDLLAHGSANITFTPAQKTNIDQINERLKVISLVDSYK